MSGSRFRDGIAPPHDTVASSAAAMDPVVCAVRAFMAGRESWTGRACDLLAALAPHAPAGTRADGAWPSNPQQLSVRLMNAAVVLRACGLMVEQRRTNRARRLVLRRQADEQPNDSRIAPPAGPTSTPSTEAAHVREVLDDPLVREALAIFEPESVDVQLVTGARWIAGPAEPEHESRSAETSERGAP